MLVNLKKYAPVLLIIFYAIAINSAAVHSYNISVNVATSENFDIVLQDLKTSKKTETIFRPYNSTDFSLDIVVPSDILPTPSKPVFMDPSEFFFKAYSLQNAPSSRDLLYNNFQNYGWVTSTKNNLLYVEYIPGHPNTLGIVSFTDLVGDSNYKSSVDGVFINFTE